MFLLILYLIKIICILMNIKKIYSRELENTLK